ncbi:MAG: hypothetical protein A2452_06835 [Candidatus Firestonebacteria bacterium RIFOXYC2_FULL_39_67]|nr:MAG: hypothetical protein A2452_06835 [Candidatus Firestonebacteria bacterium RIFOXYC2_FULL_39_67]
MSAEKYKAYDNFLKQNMNPEYSIYWSRKQASDFPNIGIKSKWLYCRMYKCIIVLVKAMIDERNRRANADIKPNDFSDIALIGCVIILQTCEAVGRLCTGKGYSEKAKGNNYCEFKHFVSTYLVGNKTILRNIEKDEFIDVLWRGFRNSLSHGLFVSQGELTEANEELIGWKVGSKVEINLETLLKYFEEGMDCYFKEIEESSDTAIQNNFNEAFDKYLVLLERKTAPE